MDLDLKTGYKCNNNCIFCVQCDNKYKGNRKTKDLILDLIESRDRCDSVVFTGGEVTIRDDLVYLVRKAKELGYKKIQIQTNGRMFSSVEYCKKIIDTGANQFAISLHGDTIKLHDELTRVSGSFLQTVKAIRNLKKMNQYVLSNTVIVSKNYKNLSKIAYLLKSLNIDSIQFSFVHAMSLKFDYSLVPRKSDVVPYLFDTLKILNNIPVFVEAIPQCLLKNYENLVSLPPSVEIKSDFFDRDFGFTRKNEAKIKFKKCLLCKYDNICEGPWKEYVDIYNDNEFLPVLKKKYKVMMKDCEVNSNFKNWHESRKVFLDFIDKPGKILDVGCASGFLLMYLDLFSSYKLQLYGIDILSGMTKKAKKIFNTDTFECVDLRKYETNNRFDYILLSFHFFDNGFDINSIISKYLRLLSDNGKLLLYVYSDFGKMDNMDELVKEMGYDIIDFKQHSNDIRVIQLK